MKKLITGFIFFVSLVNIITAQNDFFPIGIWDVWQGYGTLQSSTYLDEVGDSSKFNVVQSYAYYNVIDHGTYGDVDSFLSTANSYGLKVLVNIPKRPTNGSEPFFQANDYSVANALIDHIENSTSTAYNSSTIYGYHIADEPHDSNFVGTVNTKYISPSNLETAYIALKAHTSKKFFIAAADGNVNDTAWAWNDYNNATDILINDTYMDHNNAHPNENWVRLLHKYDDIVNHHQPVQALISVQPATNNQRNSWKELRFQTYTALIHGARGIWYYSYKQTYNSNSVAPDRLSPYFRNTLAPLSEQLSGIENFLKDTTIIGSSKWGQRSEKNSFATSNSDDIEYIIKKNGSSYVIIAANISDQQRNDVKLYLRTLPVSESTLALKQATECLVLSSDSTQPTGTESLDVINGVLTDSFDSYSAKVYIFNNPTNSNTADELRAIKVKANTSGYYWESDLGNGNIPTTYSDALKDDGYWQVTAITYGDFDGDGIDERVTASSSPGYWQSKIIMDTENSAPVLYNESSTSNDNSYFPVLATGDSDGDGIDELTAIRVKPNVDGYWEYNSNGSLPTPFANINKKSTNYQVTAMTYGDYNGDGVDERVTAYYSEGLFETKVIMETDNSNVTLFQQYSYNDNDCYFPVLASGDTDGDGRDELRAIKIEINDDGYWEYNFAGSGLPTSLGNGTYKGDYWHVTAMTYGDYNGDGIDERVTAFSSPDYWETKVMVDYIESNSEIIPYHEYSSDNNYCYFPVLASGNHTIQSQAKENHEELTEKFPNSFELSQNYPNPFNPSTTISYSIANQVKVTLKVYDILGREVAVLVNKNQDAGKYNIQFNAGHLASGVYIYRLTTGEFANAKSMVLLK